MTQSTDNKSTPSANQKSESHPPKVMKIEEIQKTETQKPKVFALPPEDARLEHMHLLTRMPTYSLLDRVKMFLSSLFGK